MYSSAAVGRTLLNFEIRLTSGRYSRDMTLFAASGAFRSTQRHTTPK